MYKSFLLFFIVLASCTTPKSFSEKALNDTFITLDGKSIQFKEIIEVNKGKKILVNVWASWCKDCIVSFSGLKQLQIQYPGVVYVFISSDRSVFRWKKALEKYNLKGNHYYMSKGMDSDFGDFLNSNWIPRYLVINENGFLDLFKAKRITDSSIVEALKK
ncbi:MAG: TlpA family protein disulfide reductase [Flavobacteriaceae bacterium]|nr:TlpA family protein disulfide reductase [Flavobacteriaceae bacterium]